MPFLIAAIFGFFILGGIAFAQLTPQSKAVILETSEMGK
jgi:hypothetical protein